LAVASIAAMVTLASPSNSAASFLYT
jgi:hypothetical protein